MKINKGTRILRRGKYIDRVVNILEEGCGYLSCLKECKGRLEVIKENGSRGSGCISYVLTSDKFKILPQRNKIKKVK